MPAPERTARLAAKFPTHFLPRRKTKCLPKDPSVVLGLLRSVSLDQVLQHLELELAVGYSLCFSNRDECAPLFAETEFKVCLSLIVEVTRRPFASCKNSRNVPTLAACRT